MSKTPKKRAKPGAKKKPTKKPAAAVTAPPALGSSSPPVEGPRPIVRVEIRNRWSNAILYAGDHKDVRDAVLAAVKGRANLRSADLGSADLRGADLRGADLRSADLRGADLRGADLGSANLRSADLRGAVGFNPRRCVNLFLLLDQPARMRLYKLVTSTLESPISQHGRLKYEIGSTVEVLGANTDPLVDCGAGVNVADLPWVMREWHTGCRILVVEFEAKDIAAIPHASDGKIRLFRCTVVGEKDLVELGLVEAPKPEAPKTEPTAPVATAGASS